MIEDSSRVGQNKPELQGDSTALTGPRETEPASKKSPPPFGRRGILKLGALTSAATGATAVSALGAASAWGAPNDRGNSSYVPISEKGSPSGVATLDDKVKIPIAQVPDLSTLYPHRNGADTTNTRLLSLNSSSFDGQFNFSKISANQDGLIAVKDLNVSSGFGGQVGQGGDISYFKAIGIAAHHSGPGNYDHFWGSLYHDGTREAGMFIGDITGRCGGNVYGGHFRVRSDSTPPPYMVGLALELVPNVTRGRKTTAALGITVPAQIDITSVELADNVQLTTGTNISFTAADGSAVVAYVSEHMATLSRVVPVTAFSSKAPIYAGSAVVIGVDSTYVGLDIQNNGTASASAAISISQHGGAQEPYIFGINFDASSSSSAATAIMVGGAWGSGINLNANSIVQAGSIAGVGSSPHRDVRVADNLLLDNSRHLKFRDSNGTAQKVLSVTAENNLRLKLAAQDSQIEFFDSKESTVLGRITSSGRADFPRGGVTTKCSSGPNEPPFLTNGHIEVWHDTVSGSDFLIINVDGKSKKVGLT